MNSVLLNAAIDQIIVDLSEPTTSEEENQGWTDPLKKRWRDWFVELKADLKARGRHLPAGAS
jgi:hypothetical protein